MAETSIYVPVLKGKRGEYLALRHLMYSCFRFITPLIDLVPPAQKRKKGAKSKSTSLASQMAHHAKEISECWRFADMPIFVDTQLMPNSGLALQTICDLLKNHNLVPTHGPGRTESYADTVVEIVTKNTTRGACYRIPKSALYDPGVDQHLKDFIARCTIRPADIDVIVDLEDIEREPSDESFMALIGRINSLPHLQELRSLTITGGSFPVNLTGTQSGASMRTRLEWKLWQALIAGKRLLRRPRYGDYGIQSPTLSNAGFLGKANLRYTSTDVWIVFRGSKRIDQRTKTHNLSAEMKSLCKLASRHTGVQQSGYSWADEYIWSCAGLEEPANDAPKWKAVGFNHHMTYVVNQLHAST